MSPKLRAYAREKNGTDLNETVEGFARDYFGFWETAVVGADIVGGFN